MKKSFVFLNDVYPELTTRIVFCDRNDSRLILLTVDRFLLIGNEESFQCKINLPDFVEFGENESPIICKEFERNCVFLVTNHFNFFVLEISQFENKVKNGTKLDCKYTKNQSDCRTQKIVKIGSFLLFHNLKFIFGFDFAKKQFKIVKLLNNEVTKMELNAKNQLVVLAKRDFFIFEVELKDGNLSIVQKTKEMNHEYVDFVCENNKLVFLTIRSGFVIYDPQINEYVDKLTLKTKFIEEPKFSKIFMIAPKKMVAADASFLYVFAKNKPRVQYVICIEDFDNVVIDGNVINSIKKISKIVKTGFLQNEFYTNETMKLQFENKKIDTQYSILKIYLTKLAFKTTIFHRQLDLLKSLLSGLRIKKELMSDPKFKTMVGGFFSVLNRFIIGRFDKFYMGKISMSSLNNSSNITNIFAKSLTSCEQQTTHSKNESKEQTKEIKSGSSLNLFDEKNSEETETISLTESLCSNSSEENEKETLKNGNDEKTAVSEENQTHTGFENSSLKIIDVVHA